MTIIKTCLEELFYYAGLIIKGALWHLIAFLATPYRFYLRATCRI